MGCENSHICPTSDEGLLLWNRKKIEKENTNMMDIRWEYFEFTRPLTVLRKMEPSGKSFSCLTLSYVPPPLPPLQF